MPSPGRPTKYKQEYDEQAEKLCKLGATDEEIADFFEVDVSTINNWKIDYPHFFESIKKGKILADSNVAERLYQRALGFEHDSEEIKVSDGEVIRVQIRKIYPPDATAAIFWLKNRRPKDWRDKQEVDQRITGNVQFNGIEIVQPNEPSPDTEV
jgi:hypothetical protein